jgi:hypothetical protein
MVALLDGTEREQCYPRPARRIGRAGYRSWLLVVLVVVAVAHRRLGPSSSARTRPRIGRCRSQQSTSAAGVEGLRFHDLRHSAATLALAAGANTRELMERMGHTSPQVALRYQHVMAGRDQAIAAALDELVQAAATLPPERPAESPGGTLVARTRRAKGGRSSRSAGESR